MEEHSRRHKIKKWLNELSNEHAAYLLGLFFLGVATLTNEWPYVNFLWISLGFFLWGLLLWTLVFVEKIIQSLIGKAIGGIFLVAATTFNLAFAASVVNQTLQAPASAFGYTHTLVAILTIPFTAALFFSFTSLLLIPVAAMSEVEGSGHFMPKGLITGKMFRGKQKPWGPIFIFRLMASIVLFVISFSFLQNNQPYSDTISRFTRWFTYNFEMEAVSYCKLSTGTRVVYLGGDKIVTGKFENKAYQFKIDTCESTP